MKKICPNMKKSIFKTCSLPPVWLISPQNTLFRTLSPIISKTDRETPIFIADLESAPKISQKCSAGL